MSATIAWQRTAAPGSWTLNHLTRDDKTTLCGLRIPTVVFNISVRGDGAADCKKCEARK